MLVTLKGLTGNAPQLLGQAMLGNLSIHKMVIDVHVCKMLQHYLV